MAETVETIEAGIITEIEDPATMRQLSVSQKAKEYLELEEQVAKLKKRIEELRADLTVEIGEGNTFMCENRAFTVVEPSTVDRFSSSKFKAENPVLYEQYVVETHKGAYLRVSKPRSK